MYTNLTCQYVSFAVATLSNILNDKHIPQKMQKPICQIQEKRTKKCSEDFVCWKSFLSCDALRILGGHSVLFVRMPKILVRERSREHSQERSRNVRWSVFFAAFGTSLSANAECSCLRAFVKPLARKRSRTEQEHFGSQHSLLLSGVIGDRANTNISHSALLECYFYFYWLWRHNANGVTHAEREVVVAAVTRKLSKLLNTVIQY